MKLVGKLYVGAKVQKIENIEMNDENKTFRDLLEECLIGVCKKLEISTPLWFKKNTKEFISFKRTSFHKEQFVEETNFDRFEIVCEDSSRTK